MIPDRFRWIVLRLCDYDPSRAARIEASCTLTEIAEAATIKSHDLSIKPVSND